MALNQRVAVKASSFKGQKSGLPLESYSLDSGMLISCLHLKEGAMEKVYGGVEYTSLSEPTTGDQGGIKSIFAGFSGTVFAQRYKQMFFLFPPIIQSSDPLNPYEILPSYTLDSEKAVYQAAWRDKIFLTNTVDAAIFIKVNESSSGFGFNSAKHGMDPIATPLLAAWFSQSGASGLIDGDYNYLITTYDSRTNSESPACGAWLSTDGIYELSPNGSQGPKTAAFTVSGGPRLVAISRTNLIPYLQAAVVANPRASHFIIYRSGGLTGGLYGTFNRVPLVDGTSTQNGQVFINIGTFISENKDFIDGTATAALQAVSLPENNSPPPTPARMVAAYNYASASLGASQGSTSTADYSGFRHIKFFRDQMFGIGASSAGFFVNQMSILGTAEKVSGTINNYKDLLHGSEVYQPDYWPYVWEVGRGDGQQSTALGILGDTALLVYKETSAYYLAGSSPDNYVLRIMDPSKGCIHHSTQQDTPIGSITLDRTGFVLWNKIGQGEAISKQIQDVIDDIDFAYIDSFYSAYDPVNNRYYCSVVQYGFTKPNITCVFDTVDLGWTTEQGREGASASIGAYSDNYLVRTGAADSIGKFYHLIGGQTTGAMIDASNPEVVLFLGNPLYSVFFSGAIDFGNDQHKKKMKWVYLRCRSLGDWTVNVEIVPDGDEARKFVLEDFNVLANFSEWYSSDLASDGNLIWDEGYWASDAPVRQTAKIPVSCIGYTFQIRIINKAATNDQYGFAIESISAEGVMMGR